MVLYGTFDTAFIDGLVRATIALFVVVNPIGLVPLVASMTSSMSKQERNHVVQTTIYTFVAVLIAFAIAGQQLLLVFGISIESFSIAGGLLLLLLAFELLLKGWRVEGPAKEAGAVPLAFPLMAGPGAITTLIITIESSGLVIALIAVGVVVGLTVVTFRLIDPIHRFLGNLGSSIISRVMAIFIAAIAVEFILQGFVNFFYL